MATEIEPALADRSSLNDVVKGFRITQKQTNIKALINKIFRQKGQ